MFERTQRQGNVLSQNRKIWGQVLTIGAMTVGMSGSALQAESSGAVVTQNSVDSYGVAPVATPWSTTIVLLLMLESLREILDEPVPEVNIVAAGLSNVELFELEAVAFVADYGMYGIDPTLTPEEAEDYVQTTTDAWQMTLGVVHGADQGIVSELNATLEQMKADLEDMTSAGMQ